MTASIARRILMLSGAIVAAAAGGAAAAAGPIGSRIESCVSQAAIEFGPVDQHVVLEPEDQSRVQAEMERRYPMLQRNGFPVSKIVLWHRLGSGEALFVTLLEHPTQPDEACFTATFAAARFDDIDGLKRKYLRPEVAI